MIAASVVSAGAMVALGILSMAFLLTVYRVVAGPTLPDRVLALDMLVAIVIGFIAVIAIKTGFTLYIDIAISLGLVGFLATVAFARFILTQGQSNAAERIGAVQSADLAAEGRKIRRRKRKKGGR
ncbi:MULTISPECIES: cation:proton antiporter [Rhizobium]|uniref:Cation:proton antiporter n=1 Tax=Rhizobium tropici TaxID=398 RepID=A0A6P1CDC7_RHITR|nr:MULTISPECIES: cation:proton antiporter [Rhizobium]AGB70479.1 Na(+)/H(+) antiporter subunit F [Rhizobium tropici CIAT 899]MBB4241426.1 multicomponent Na+:H+ antiporter subunit F [Rhizobium tropici]MBB5592834.1 multicomponent Na+:H+ antiporter subunit F [Rhizobium tropici]MBB6491876.1 multicomponent Na+:H+ antiporter subunit F [Rhizobium tropici]NEV14356.1 cation:proton antiporter [Rhizobium tropici]